MGGTSTTSPSKPAAKAAASPSKKQGSSPSTAASAATGSTPTPAVVTAAAASSNPPAGSAVTTLKKLPQTSHHTLTLPNSFQECLERLDDEKQVSYLLLGASEVFPDFNVKRTHPYSYFFFKKKGYKQVFQPNKHIIVQEIKRRNPDAKPNQNNRSNDELMVMLRERWPLVGPDKEFVIQKEKEYRELLLSVLNPKDVIQLDELTDLVALPTNMEGLAAPTGSSIPSRKRSFDPSNNCNSATGVGSSSSTLGNAVNSTGSGTTGASYYETARNNKRRASTSSMNGAANSGHHSSISNSALEARLIQVAKECADKLSFANLAITVETLRKERFELHMKKLPLISEHTPSNVQSMAFMDNRIKEITDSIVRYETKMGSSLSMNS